MLLSPATLRALRPASSAACFFWAWAGALQATRDAKATTATRQLQLNMSASLETEEKGRNATVQSHYEPECSEIITAHLRDAMGQFCSRGKGFHPIRLGLERSFAYIQERAVARRERQPRPFASWYLPVKNIMLAFLTILLMLIVAYAQFREGIFTALTVLINIVIAGVIAFN